VVVDDHVQILEAGEACRAPLDPTAVLTATIPDHAVAGAAHRDPAELLDVDVDELARVAAFVAVRRLDRLEPRALAEPDPLQPERDRREWQREQLGDLRGRHPQAPQPLDRVHPLLRQPGWAVAGSRGTIEQPPITSAETGEPLRRSTDAATGRLGSRRQRPLFLEHPPADQQTTARTGPMVSVQLHPVPSLGLVASTPPASREARMNNVLRNYT
jgi:hypothetical protein